MELAVVRALAATPRLPFYPVKLVLHAIARLVSRSFSASLYAKTDNTILAFLSYTVACTATGGSVGQCLPKDQVKIQAVDETDDSTEEPASPAASQANARRTKRRLSDSLDAYMNHQVRSSDLRRAFARHAPRKHA